MTDVDDAPLSSSDPALEGLLCFAVYSAGLAFGRVYRPMLDATGLTYAQYIVMVILWGRDDRTVGDLCEAMFLSTNTLTPVLQKLERRGLVQRNRSRDDERQVRLQLTPAGRALQADVRSFPECISAATGLDTAGMQQLHGILAALRDRLIAPEAKAAPRRLKRRQPTPVSDTKSRAPRGAASRVRPR